MCTLTYIPNNTQGFLLTSNRDESVMREPAFTPAIYEHHQTQLMYPKDPQGGGTWILTASNQFTLCLLNGAFERHRPNPPYRQSRGLVVTQFFDYNDAEQFVAEYPFAGIEPFTLVIIHCKSKITIHEVRWDGTSAYVKVIDGTKPQIWSSATLYEPEVIAARKHWFDSFVTTNPHPELQDMLHFHHFGGTGNAVTDLLINRENILRTVSITAVEVYRERITMHYEDIVAGTSSVLKLLG